jgi:flavin reductase (DIM6/NTAB) family NADH-FMN oxidoreductase RutF
MKLPPPIALARLLERSRHPMLVATAAAGDERDGCLIGFSTQCSMNPVRMLVCLSPANRTYRIATQTDALAIHHLDAGDLALAELFGEHTGDEIDKLTRCNWHPGPAGTVVLDGVRHWWVGVTVDRVGLGDHEGFVLEPASVHIEGAYRPLDSTAVAHLEAGHPRQAGRG